MHRRAAEPVCPQPSPTRRRACARSGSRAGMTTGPAALSLHRPQAAPPGIESAPARRRRGLRRVRRPSPRCLRRTDAPTTTLAARPGGRAGRSAPHSVLCDRTAAWIHGVDVFRYPELDVCRHSSPTCCAATTRPTAPSADGGTRDLLPVDWWVIGGVRVTTPIRTAVDLGCKLRARGLAALDAFARGHRLDRRRHASGCCRATGAVAGVVQAAHAGRSSPTRGRSPSGESWARLEILDDGLPLPELQHWVDVDGVPTYRLDLAYPHAQVAASSTTARSSTRARQQRARDDERRERGCEGTLGWTSIVLTKESTSPRRAARRAGSAELAHALRSRRRPPRW